MLHRLLKVLYKTVLLNGGPGFDGYFFKSCFFSREGHSIRPEAPYSIKSWWDFKGQRQALDKTPFQEANCSRKYNREWAFSHLGNSVKASWRYQGLMQRAGAMVCIVKQTRGHIFTQLKCRRTVSGSECCLASKRWKYGNHIRRVDARSVFAEHRLWRRSWWTVGVARAHDYFHKWFPELQRNCWYWST